MKKKPGFSLLELSFILFIVMILLGFSMPRFSRMFDSDLQLQTQKLAILINELRQQAILRGENHKLVFDTQKSEYQVFTSKADQPQQFLPHPQYEKPVSLTPPVEFAAVTRLDNPENSTRFAGDRITFDKIFGQQFQIMIDSSGFVDLFTLRLKDKENQLSLSVVDIMGKVVIGRETRL
ncbi:type II secretion system GspH family protein [bacterium]|nr:type II secretion system GspH family protein [bacterium]